MSQLLEFKHFSILDNEIRFILYNDYEIFLFYGICFTQFCSFESVTLMSSFLTEGLPKIVFLSFLGHKRPLPAPDMKGK